MGAVDTDGDVPHATNARQIGRDFWLLTFGGLAFWEEALKLYVSVLCTSRRQRSSSPPVQWVFRHPAMRNYDWLGLLKHQPGISSSLTSRATSCCVLLSAALGTCCCRSHNFWITRTVWPAGKWQCFRGLYGHVEYQSPMMSDVE
jgi:hypothetical protein